MERGWFFGNSLDGKHDDLLMCCCSDHCCSCEDPESLSEKSFDETFASIVKLGKSSGVTLLRTTSDPLERNESSLQLLRAPSLPAVFETKYEDLDDDDDEFSMGRLITQASLNDLDTFTSKRWGLTRHQSMKQESFARLNSPSRLNPDMNLNHLKVEQVGKSGGPKELGSFYVDDKELGQNVISKIIAGLKGNETRQKSAPASLVCVAEYGRPAMKWSDERSTKETKMKIKSWARAVVANLRREC